MPCVYFIQKGEQDVYKVGMSSIDAKSRLGSLQTGNEQLLTLRATIECPSAHTAEQVEKYLHEVFSKSRLQGEWFHMTWIDVLGVLSYYETRNYPTETMKIQSRSRVRFTVGSNGAAKDKDAILLKRALTRVAALEKANAELLAPRLDRIRKEARAEFYPEIKIVERELELRDREIARLKAQLARAQRPSWWQRLTRWFNQLAQA